MADSRIEAILENILGENNTILDPVSRNETLLIEIMNMLDGVANQAITSEQITQIVNFI